MDISKISYVLRAIGLRGILRTLYNSIYRDVIEYRYAAKSVHEDIQYPGTLISATPSFNGFCALFTNAAVEISFLSKNMLRVCWQPGKTTPPYTIEKTDWEILNPVFEAFSDCVSLSFEGKSLLLSKIGEVSIDDPQNSIFYKANTPSRVGEQWSISVQLLPDEHIYGLGERAAKLNLRPGEYHSWNTDPSGKYTSGTDPLYIGTPIYLSVASAGCYLVYFENSYRSTFSINKEITATFEGGTLKYYLIFGSLESIYRELGGLLGKPFIPPRWSLGYHQSKWSYRSEDEVLNLLEGFKKYKLPISAVHLDIDYMDGFRVFSINSHSFPDMKVFSEKLAADGVKIVASINPAVKLDKNYSVYSSGVENDVFSKLPGGRNAAGVSWAGRSLFPDFAQMRTQEWWSSQYKHLVDQGISGIWHDMNEPASFVAWGDMSLPQVVKHNMDGEIGDHREFHNLYGLMMNKAGFEGLRTYSPAKRPWIFSRSGWAGLQKYAWTWTGDVECSWSALKQTISTMLGLSLSGHAFSGVDIGGFDGNPDAELYLRWFQMAAFFPLFRTHSAVGTKPREPWVYGDATTDIIRNFLQLRYKLIPYLYSITWDACQTGIPALRPLFWIDPSKQFLFDIDDQFLLGASLLIAPIIEKGAVSRTVTLPPGYWYSWWDDSRFQGPAQIKLEAHRSIIPIFIRGGTILPMDENGSLSLHIFPEYGRAISTHLYNDAGDGYGEWRLDNFQSHFNQGFVDITWSSEGKYAFPYPRIDVILHGEPLLQAMADNVLVEPLGNTISISPFNLLHLQYI